MKLSDITALLQLPTAPPHSAAGQPLVFLRAGGLCPACTCQVPALPAVAAPRGLHQASPAVWSLLKVWVVLQGWCLAVSAFCPVAFRF